METLAHLQMSHSTIQLESLPSMKDAPIVQCDDVTRLQSISELHNMRFSDNKWENKIMWSNVIFFLSLSDEWASLRCSNNSDEVCFRLASFTNWQARPTAHTQYEALTEAYVSIVAALAGQTVALSAWLCGHHMHTCRDFRNGICFH